jgi:sulfur carrier protein ThiS
MKTYITKLRHDIANLLTPIIGTSELVAVKYNDSFIKDSMHTIEILSKEILKVIDDIIKEEEKD